MDETLKKQILEVQAGNREVLNDLIKQNNGLIWSIVKRFEGRGYELEDLYQIGAIGFIKSVQKFDFSFNVALSTYAVTFIIGEIKRFLRDDGMIKVSRQTKSTCQKALKIKEDYEKLGKKIGIDEIAKLLKVSKDEVIASLEYKNCLESLYEKEDEDGICLIDKIKTNENEEEKTINRLALKEGIEKLKPREKEIIYLRYFKGQTQKDVAKLVGISQVQVCRIEKQILSTLGEELKEA